MSGREVLLFVHWERFLQDLLTRTEKFPKAVRGTFTQRIENIALDVFERIVEAQYTNGARKATSLREADLGIAKLRVLLRMTHERAYLSHGGYEHVMRALDEAGRMVGGWRASLGGGERG